MKLQVFDGGLATRLYPQLIQQNQGVVYENIDNATGVLTPLKNKLQVSTLPQPYPYFFEAKDQWVYKSTDYDFIEVNDQLYMSDGVNRPIRQLPNGTERFVGIANPTFTPVLSVVDEGDAKLSAEIPNSFEVATLAGGNLPAIELLYRVYGVRREAGTIVAMSTAMELRVPYNPGSSVSAYTSPHPGNIKASSDYLKYGGAPETYFLDPASFAVTEPKAIFPAVGFVGAVLSVFRKVEFRQFQIPAGSDYGIMVFRHYKNKWHQVAVSYDAAPVITDATYEISNKPVLDTSFLDKVSAFYGTYQYLYTFYNSAEGLESGPSPLSNEVATTGASQLLVSSMEVPTDPQVDQLRVYRIGGNLAQFTLAYTIPRGMSGMFDHLTDDKLDGRLLNVAIHDPAPAGLRYLTESYSMVFGAVGKDLRYTPIGKPTVWPDEYVIPFEAEITGIGAAANGLLVMTKHKTHIITGTSPDTLAKQLLSGDQGCLGFRSIQQVKNGAVVWASADGLCMSVGGEVPVVTRDILGDLKLKPARSVVLDENYYLFQEDGTCLNWDYRHNPIFKNIDFGVSYAVAAKGDLYGVGAGKLWKLKSDESKLTMRYRSPRFVEGSLTKPKTYKKVYFRAEGDIILNILIDDVLVGSYTRSGKATHEVQVPADKQRGFYIQFEVEGTGTIHELEYEASAQR